MIIEVTDLTWCSSKTNKLREKKKEEEKETSDQCTSQKHAYINT